MLVKRKTKKLIKGAGIGAGAGIAVAIVILMIVFLPATQRSVIPGTIVINERAGFTPYETLYANHTKHADWSTYINLPGVTLTNTITMHVGGFRVDLDNASIASVLGVSTMHQYTYGYQHNTHAESLVFSNASHWYIAYQWSPVLINASLEELT